MIIYSIIQKSQLEGALRMDAEYYQPEFFIDFSKGNWVSIGDILKVCQYGISQAMNEEKIGQPIFKMDDIKNAFLVDDKIKYADITPQIFKQFKLRKNDVLFNRVNSEEFVGRTGIFKLDGDFVFASYLIRLQTKDNSEILPDYLNIFLNSSFGIKQIKKYRRRAVNQANVNAEELKLFKISVLPIKFQKEIEILSNKSWQNFEKSKSLYSQAENLLLEELGLSDFNIEDEIYNIINLSEVKKANRIDAEFFQVKYEKLIKKIKKYNGGFINLGDKKFAELKRGSLISDKFYTQEKGIGYIRGADFSNGILKKEKLVYINKKFKINNEVEVKENDIVFSLIGSVGASAFVEKSFDNYFISNNTGKISLKVNFNPIVLQVFLQSVAGKLQFEKEKTQTAQPKISIDQLSKFKIPLIKPKIQKQIAEKIQESHKLRKESKELLEKAKRKVEKMILG